MADIRAGNGDNTFCQRNVVDNGIPYCIGSCNVLYHYSHRGRQSAGRYLSVERSVNQLFFAALRIFRFKSSNFNIVVSGSCFSQSLDGIAFVFFDGDDHLLGVDGPLQQSGAFDDLFRICQHQFVVIRQERFAFRTVDDQRIDFRTFWRQQLDTGWECSATQADDASSIDDLDNFVGRQLCYRFLCARISGSNVVALPADNDGCGFKSESSLYFLDFFTVPLTGEWTLAETKPCSVPMS